jgi:hypothetical protein
MRPAVLQPLRQGGSSVVSAMVAAAVFALGMALAHQRLALHQLDAAVLAEQQQAMGLGQSLSACWQRWPNPCTSIAALSSGLTVSDTVQVGQTAYTRSIRIDTVGTRSYQLDITISWPDARASNSGAVRTWRTVVTGRYGLD